MNSWDYFALVIRSVKLDSLEGPRETFFSAASFTSPATNARNELASARVMALEMKLEIPFIKLPMKLLLNGHFTFLAVRSIP